MKKNIHIILSMILLLVTIAIFGPVELYCTNYEEFWFSPKDMTIVSIILFAVIGVLGGIIGLLLKGKAREIYGCILFSVGIAAYLQGNYININYGVLNGKDINWGQYRGYAILDTLIWLLIIGVSVYLYTHKTDIFRKIQTYASIWIIAIEFVTLGVLLMTTDVLKNEKSTYYLSDEGIYEVSAKDNIIIFALDSFDDEYYQEIYNDDSEKYQEVFDNFTYFNNALVGGASTKIGMPVIITGDHYPGTVTYKDYISESFDRDGLYTTLKKENYDVRIYSNSSFIPDGSESLVDNQVSAGYSVESFPKLARKYFSLTLYKYMPHILKRFFWVYTGEFDQFMKGNSANEYKLDDAAFFEKLMENHLSVNEEENVFRIIHLMGPHPPFTLDEYVNVVGSGQTSAVRQGKGALYIVEKYIENMKELGVYDSSTIIIMADHGTMNLKEHGILLVKKKNSDGEYTESDAPVSYYDLHSTLFKELGINNGLSFFEIPPDKRTRYFYLNETDAGNMSVVEYVANGDFNEDIEIQPTGNILSQERKKEKYKYGTQLTFGANNTAYPYVLYGISSTDMKEFSWTDGKQCEFLMELESPPKNNLLITLNIQRINGEKQKVVCYVDDTVCYRETLTVGKQLQFVVPKDILEDANFLNLRLELPYAISPSEVWGDGYDARMLSLAITGLRIDETKEEANLPAYEAPDHYSFGTNGNADQYLLNGWYESEDGHVWASGYADVAIQTSQLSDYNFEIRFSSYEPSGDIDIYINDFFVQSVKAEASPLHLSVARELLKENGNQVISFHTPNAVSPNEVEGAEEKRILGICLYSIDIMPTNEN